MLLLVCLLPEEFSIHGASQDCLYLTLRDDSCVLSSWMKECMTKFCTLASSICEFGMLPV